MPLDFMISTKLNFMKKFEKLQKAGDTKTKMHKAVHAKDMEAHNQGMVLIDEFKFPHVAF